LLKLHAHYARMQSVALQSSATPCGSHGYRHEEALALRARLRGFAATLGIFNNDPSALGTFNYEPTLGDICREL
jgi:hypothetical protein